MKTFFTETREFLTDILFPRFCIGCRKKGTYLCNDCLSLINLSNKVLQENKELSSIYFACDYENFIAKKLVQKLKYEPFAKKLAQTLSDIIILYLFNLENTPEFLKEKQEFLLIPVPLSKKRLKWRGFNQAEEIAQYLSKQLEIPLKRNILTKVKDTIPQIKLSGKQRKENVKNTFRCQKPEIIKDKRILLVDDVSTTGATLQEAGKVLKQAGAKQVCGIVFAKR